MIIVSNHLPIHAKRNEQTGDWDFQWDQDALVAQAKDGIKDDFEVIYVGCLNKEIDPEEQEVVTKTLRADFNCAPVFLGSELKDKYYQGFCKQQLWPMLHYVLPVSPSSQGRFDPELWQAYVKANKIFTDKLVEVLATDTDFVWIHDYHLLVLPSLLRKRFHRIRCALFLHSPFPSSEIFRTFVKREEILRSLLNTDLIGFHTFDYARHFLSCCSRMLGLEHVTNRGSISIEYYGRNVGIKIIPTGVNPQRLLGGFQWSKFQWRRGELRAQFAGKTVLVGVDDMDSFKGIDLKLQAFQSILREHPEWNERLVLVQITNPPRMGGREIQELHGEVRRLVQEINEEHGSPRWQPVLYLENVVELHDRMAFYSVADCAVVTAVRDGMNLMPYEYVVCRQGPEGDAESARDSMLVVSEFVGCSPSLTGAIRVNPWSIDSVAQGLYKAVKMPLEHRKLRHDKHWKYVSTHTVAYWAQAFVGELQKVTKDHSMMKCYGLGLGLDTFRMVALDANFRKLEDTVVQKAYHASQRRVFFLDYDGTLVAPSSISSAPPEQVLSVLRALTRDPCNLVYIISGRPQQELEEWFASVDRLGIAAEHGFFFRQVGSERFEVLNPHADLGWIQLARPVLQQYQECTDGSFIEEKQSALVWHYRDADPDLGALQAKELLDHLDDVLGKMAVEVVGGQAIVEVKPQGVSKGGIVERILKDAPTLMGGTPGGLTLGGRGMPDFILCIGDDRSDEDMFNAIEHPPFSNARNSAEVFACTVGQKPSRAPFYLNDHMEVLDLLARITGTTLPITSYDHN